ncbi:hypothetical protein, partial [uncultured Bifidobacterium sp.]|uniref:GltB/FmdC/FwdC-like GXGXG domain-containing protein n=1 Tax=uncultured Bifidobacterium sp. TaxID=165187 RepID=UPI002608C68B
GGTVVVLGGTGRNFGAGFSGGRAFVLDLDINKINPGALKTDSLRLQPLDDEESELVRSLVERHRQETGSRFAADLLEDWHASALRFTSIAPRAYLAMSQAMVVAEKNHVDFNAPGAWENVYEQVMEGAH